jgi:hypothetical protein
MPYIIYIQISRFFQNNSLSISLCTIQCRLVKTAKFPEGALKPA